MDNLAFLGDLGDLGDLGEPAESSFYTNPYQLRNIAFTC